MILLQNVFEMPDRLNTWVSQEIQKETKSTDLYGIMEQLGDTNTDSWVEFK